MQVSATDIPGLILITPDVYTDERGSFREVFMRKKFFEVAGIDFEVCQHNMSVSHHNVLRGLHFQWDKPLAKLIRCTGGRALMYALDMRKKSATFGWVFSQEFLPQDERILYAPFGFGTGFLALEDDTKIEYLYNNYYNKDGESNISMLDSALALPGLSSDELYAMSPRDSEAPTFEEWKKSPESVQFDF